jgi:glycerol-3-phosphate acyltransferase PlsX
MRIAVDAMGGDSAPGAIVDGAVAAARQLNVGITLVGAAEALEAALSAHPDWRALQFEIVDTPEAVSMADAPAATLRRKPRASIRVAAELVARGEAAALFSAGNTGATVMAAHSVFGMVPGVDRPALATTIPTMRARMSNAGRSICCSLR